MVIRAKIWFLGMFISENDMFTHRNTHIYIYIENYEFTMICLIHA